MIWFTADWHFNHDKEFIYKARGFNTIQEMNETIINNINDRIKQDDIFWVLGDLCLGQDININKQLIEQINCNNVNIICGNHCTNRRIEMYKTCNNVVSVEYATRQKINGYHFYLSHFPTITSNLEKENLKQCTINLYGHTHQKTNFYLEYPFMYHVGVDSHNCTPVSIEQIIYDLEMKVKECKNYL